MRLAPAVVLLSLTSACASAGEHGAEDDHSFPPIRNTQAPGDEPNTPRQAADAWTAPDGFEVTLFAGEPDVAQPIAMTFDDRGRLWVVECFTYTGRDFDVTHGDRVVIFEDRDGDGEHDSKTVFWDRGFMTTGVEYGFGGAWVLNDGTLSFLADKNGDDVPDAEPVALLNGFTHDAGHNVVNGLAWGPDGWLYGRHGITATSLVGVPGAPDDKRTPLNCGVWRFHPTRHVFEVVAHGTTNPWGLDWNEYGDAFFTNNVIGHAWHLIPGAHYRRMFGRDFNPHLYGLIDQHADHYHWDADGGAWTASRAGTDGASDTADDLGGGHSHAGAMIYQGDNWPEEYRGDLYMCNTHGKRINRDALVPHGSGYKITHKPDFAFANSPWFKGVELKSGPDGGVFLLDWTDLGECHDHDGVHRTSGRIYKITHGKPDRAGEAVDLAGLSGEELVKTALEHPNVWHRRHAARLVCEPAVWEAKLQTKDRGNVTFSTVLDLASVWETDDAGKIIRSAADELPPAADDTPAGRLRAARLIVASWGINAVPPPDVRVCAALSPNIWINMPIIACLLSEDPRVKAASVGLLTEAALAFPSIDLDEMSALAADPPDRKLIGASKLDLTPYVRDPAPPLRLAGAALLQRLPAETRLLLASTLAEDAASADDHNLPLMIWYGVEPAVAADPAAGAKFAEGANIPLLREYTARRMTSELPSEPHAAALGALLSVAAKEGAAFQKDVLKGALAALDGRRQVAPPPGWVDVQPVFAASNDAEVRALANKLAVIFGDGAALEELRAVVTNRELPDATRAAAIESLAEARDDAVVPLLLDLLKKRRGADRNLVAAAARGLGAFDADETPAVLIAALPRVRVEERGALLATLAGRLNYARALAEALPGLGVTMLDAEHVRSLRAFDDPGINAVLDEHWGTARATPAEKLAEIAAWKAKLENNSGADPAEGREIYKTLCGRCHKLYGEGGDLGPNLTGSDRRNLDYLLGNIFDPSAVVPAAWRVSTVLLTDGRVLTGVVDRTAGDTLTVATADAVLTLPAGDILEIEPGDASLMPEGLFKTLSEEQIRDLIAYLRSDNPGR